MNSTGASSDLSAWRRAVREAERQGELLAAFDAAERGLSEYPDDRWLQHRAVLALARAGSTKEAQRRFRAYGLGEVDTEDAKALEARLEKDIGLAMMGERRRACSERAAALYNDVFESTGGYYSGINAATLYLLAGETQRAHGLAAEVLTLARRATDDRYYAAATEAEALLLLGDVDAARDALARAAELADDDRAAIATTRRQLRFLCDALHVDENLVEALPVPDVVHYCGHRITAGLDSRFRAVDESAVTERLRAAIAARSIGHAYGSLASGADILWAEAILERGAELHVIFPFEQDEFVELSVAPAGSGWVQRFHRCLEQATSVRYATEDAYLGDDVLFGYASELAMGLAILHSRHIDGEVAQLALWDGRPAEAKAGTAVDVETWRRQDLPTVIVPVEGLPREGSATSVSRTSHRVVRALLFADVKGFSRLRDEQLPSFVEHVLGAFARVLETHRRAVCYCNTWGDALYVVVTDAQAAASLALDLRAAISSFDSDVAGLPPLAMRIGAHLGPVYPITDPVLGTPSFSGSHVSRTARIEPVTPEGSIYVTERFAAALLLTTKDEFACDYVGHMPAAKDYGNLRMYRLRRARRHIP
jgi:class 3 adenylate cyclase/tetratricopeptide (TPR) repeat protein